jgi:hypothetical protein
LKGIFSLKFTWEHEIGEKHLKSTRNIMETLCRDNFIRKIILSHPIHVQHYYRGAADATSHECDVTSVERGPAYQCCCEHPAMATQERSPRRAAPEKCAARGDTVPGRPAAGRSDSGLSASATECGGDSPIPPQQPTPPCETPKLPSAAPGTASRNVPYRTLSRCWDHSVEQLHVAARLSAMRPARRQKLQSSID